MNDAFCTFRPTDSRWSSIPSMTSPINGNPLALTSSLPRQTPLGQSFGSQVPFTGLQDACSTIASNISMPNNGASLHSTCFGVPSVSCASPLSANSNSPPISHPQVNCGMQDVDDAWRGTSIAELRRKALAHTATLTGYRWTFWGASYAKCADEEIDRVTYIALWWKEKRCTKLLIIELSKYMNLWKLSNTKMTNHRTRS